MSIGRSIERMNELREEQVQSVIEEEGIRPWDTEEWKENREQVLGDECEWCGESDSVLQPHHLTPAPNWGRVWINASDEVFVESERFDSELVEGREECPNCSKRAYYKRKEKEPEYRCQDCKTEFSEPKSVSGAEVVSNDRYDTKPYISDEYLKEKSDWVIDNKPRVKEAFRQKLLEKKKDYVQMSEDEVVTICRSCHYKEEKTSLVRCGVCGSEFHKRKHDMCFDCLVDSGEVEKCEDCGDGWFNPDYNSRCSDCR